MKLKCATLAVRLFALLAVAASDSQVADESPATQVIEIFHNGLLFQMPVFEDRQFSAQRRAFDLATTKQIADYVVQMAKDAIVNRVSPTILATKRGTGMLYLLSKIYLRFRFSLKHSPDDVMAENYVSSMSGFMSKMVQANSDVVLSDEECYEQLKSFIEGFVPVVEASPVGMYLNWPAGKVNGKPISEFLAPHFKWYRDNGYNGMINMVVNISKWLKTVKLSRAPKAAEAA